RLWNLVRGRFARPVDAEVLTLGGFLLPFIALSTSQYKLPHYIFVVFPFAALLAARVIGQLLARVEAKPFRVFFSIQLFIALGVWLSAVLLCTLAFPLKSVWVWALAAAGFVCTLWFAARRQPAATRLIVPSAVAVVGANFLLNLHFYPTLLTYQAGSQAARYVASRPVILQNLYFFRYGSHAFDFYTRQITPNLPGNEAGIGSTAWVLTTAEGKNELTQRRVPYAIEREFVHYHVTKLSLPFLNPATRAGRLGRVYLLKTRPVASLPRP
ncbi:MAG: hypothetical protein H7Z75_12500, partial [Ferruginibacter sp.]|nr:hypothetical protein [Cytophagales bacterium]